ncbi:hypothetical protein ACHQM5_026348 [Ranunculus cassubicifolius]
MTKKEDDDVFNRFGDDDPTEGSSSNTPASSSDVEQPCISLPGMHGSSSAGNGNNPFGSVNLGSSSDEKEPTMISSSYRSFISRYGTGGHGWSAGNVSATNSYSLNAGNAWERELFIPRGNPFSFSTGEYAHESPENTSFVFTAGSGISTSSNSVAVKMDSNNTPFVPEEGFYQPSSEETREAYQALVSLIENYSTSAPLAVLYSYADEVLSVLKNSYITDPTVKKAKINQFLNGEGIPDFLFNQMVATAIIITDYPLGPLGYESDRNFYQPKSDSSAAGYSMLFDVVNHYLTYPQPEIVKNRTVHELLAILKNPELDIATKRERVEDSFWGKISDEHFGNLLFGSDLINDFNDDTPQNNFIVSQNPIQWRPETVVDQSHGGDQLVEVDVESTSGSSSDDLSSSDSDEESDPAADLVYSSDSDEESYAVNEDDEVVNDNEETEAKLFYSDYESAVNEDNEAANNNEESETKFVYSDEDAEANASGPKHEEESQPSAGNKLEYSSEEELIYFDNIQARGSDIEDEDGWIKIDYDDDGI